MKHYSWVAQIKLGALSESSMLTIFGLLYIELVRKYGSKP
jgi:hypothetical protein